MAGAVDIVTMAVRLTAKDALTPKLRNMAAWFSNAEGVAARSFTQMANVVEAGGWKSTAAVVGLSLGIRALSQAYDRLALSLWGFTKNLVRVAGEFETEMTKFRIIGNMTVDQMNLVGKAIIDLTGPLPTSATEVAKAATAFAKMGFMSRLGAQGIVELSLESIKFAQAIGVAEEQAAMFLGKLATWLNVQAPTAAKMKEIASMVTVLGWTIKGTAQDVIRATERFGAFVRALGATEAQTLSLAALVQDSGILIRRGSTAINRTFQLMSINAMAFGRAMERAGVVESADQFEQMFRTDPATAFRTVLVALSRSTGAYGAELLKTLGLHGNYISDLITMSRNVSGYDRSLKAATKAQQDAKNGTAATDKAYEAMMQTFAAAAKTAGGALQNLFIVMGDWLIPVVKWLAIEFSKLVSYLTKNYSWLLKLLGILIAAVSIFLLVGIVVKTLTFAFAALGIIGAASLSALFWGLLKITIIIALIVTLVILIGNLFGWWDVGLKDVTESIKDIGKEVRSTAGAMPEGVIATGTAPQAKYGGGALKPELNLPKMASGGIALSPTPVIVGEKEPEGIIPLRMMGEMLSGFAKSTGTQRGGGGSVSVSTPVYLDGMRISESQSIQREIDDLRTGRLR